MARPDAEPVLVVLDLLPVHLGAFEVYPVVASLLKAFDMGVVAFDGDLTRWNGTGPLVREDVR